MVSPSGALRSIPQVDAVVVGANSNFLGRGQPYLAARALDWPGLEARQIGPTRKYRTNMKAAGAEYGLWAYAGFNNSPYGRTAWFDRRGGRTLIEVLDCYRKEKPDFLLLSSWNDWLENTALEPGLAFDDYNGDPYLYCRILAACKGGSFEPPPLPKPAAVDPWLHRVLYGVDRTPPRIREVWHSPLEPALDVVASDADSAVRAVRYVRHGNRALRFPGRIETLGARLRFPPASARRFVTAAERPGLSMQIGTLLIEAEPAPRGPESVQHAWLHLYYFDGQPGSITVGYPAQPGVVRTFEPYAVVGRATCSGGQVWREAMIRLRHFAPSAEPWRITLRFHPSRAKKEGDGGVALGSVALVWGFSQGRLGVPRKGERSSGSTHTFQLNQIVPTDSPYDWIFVEAEDRHGNRSVPGAVDLAPTRDGLAPVRLK